MPNTMIVGYDGSERAMDAMALADLLSGPFDAQLVVAAVYQRQPAYGTVAWGAFERELRTAAEQAVTSAQARTEIAGRIVAEASSPARGLQGLAEEHDAACIVAGSSRHGPLGRITPGSTAERLLHGAPCPVAIAPAGFVEREPALRRMGVAFDGSDESRHALAAATEIVQRAGAELEVICVVESTVDYAFGGATVASNLMQDLEAEATKLVDATIAELPEGVRATPLVVPGSPSEVLAERSSGLDLICCGSRGYGLLRHVLLGGVSAKLVRESACPVLLFPRSAESQE